MKIGDLIKAYREEHGMSQEAFAARSGLSKGYVSILESGKHPRTGKPLTPSTQKVKQVADALGMSLSEIRELIEPLDWNDTISRDTPTKEELEIYFETLRKDPDAGLRRDYIIELAQGTKDMDPEMLKHLVAYMRFLKQEARKHD